MTCNYSPLSVLIEGAAVSQNMIDGLSSAAANFALEIMRMNVAFLARVIGRAENGPP